MDLFKTISSGGLNLLGKGGLDVVGRLSGSRGYEEAARNIRFEPFNIRSGYGSTTFSGGTGTFALSPEYQALRDQALGGARGFFNQAMTFDPNAASANAYGLMQQIAAPGRARELANLRDTLYGQGRLGAADATGGNPELRAFYEAQNQSDLQALLQSIGIGQTMLDSTIQRGQGFLTSATGLDTLGNDQLKLGLYGGQGGLDASKAQSDFLSKAGENEASFWNNLLFGTKGSIGGEYGIFDRGK